MQFKHLLSTYFCFIPSFSTLDARDAFNSFQNEYSTAKGVDQQLSAVNKVNISYYFNPIKPGNISFIFPSISVNQSSNKFKAMDTIRRSFVSNIN